MKEYPECAKLKSVSETSQVIGEFLDWLEHEEEIVFCLRGERTEMLYEKHLPREKTLAKFFGIDLRKVETERRAMLEDIRSIQLMADAMLKQSEVRE